MQPHEKPKRLGARLYYELVIQCSTWALGLDIGLGLGLGLSLSLGLGLGLGLGEALAL